MTEWEIFASGFHSNFPELDMPSIQELKPLLDPAKLGGTSIFYLTPLLKLFTKTKRSMKKSIKLMSRLKNCPWFYGYLSLEDAQVLLSGKDPGTFLMCFSHPIPNTLSACFVDQSKHLKELKIGRFSSNYLDPGKLVQRIPELVNAKPYLNEAYQNSAFFGSVDFATAEQILGAQSSGTYLLRLSTQTENAFVIAYVDDVKRRKQVKVTYTKGVYTSQGDAKSFQTFHSFSEIVQFYPEIFRKPSYISVVEPHISTIVQKCIAIKRNVDTHSARDYSAFSAAKTSPLKNPKTIPTTQTR